MRSGRTQGNGGNKAERMAELFPVKGGSDVARTLVEQPELRTSRRIHPYPPADLANWRTNPRFPAEEANATRPTPSRYWRLFNDPGFTPPAPNPEPLVMLAEMMQTTIPYIPQLAQALACQHSDAPQQMPQQGISQLSQTRGEQPDNGGPRRLPTEVIAENPNASVIQPASPSRNIVHVPSESDVISSDSTNSVREQLRQVNQRLDDVQREFVMSKEEIGEGSKGESPFIPEI
ncbi:hypothetical protein BHM03_00016406 [Ensete ventricosum]|nr:hypothetical protein BHM03_00016406 [Ensete ventricosum]